ncbi:hypothetical protein DH2020_045042 [Rehmannia glutinosa]|uniref:Ubiquinol oxidase n=1 Tax=Rehmannia glutinosa TaxID=99300 RepID=A0ABR0UG05_REHGL
MRRVITGGNCGRYVSSSAAAAARISALTPFDASAAGVQKQGLSTVVIGWRRMMSTAAEPSSAPAVAEKDNKTNGVATGNVGKGEVVVSSYWGIQRPKLTREDGTEWPWNCFMPWETYRADVSIDLSKHHVPKTFLDKVAYRTVKLLQFPQTCFSGFVILLDYLSHLLALIKAANFFKIPQIFFAYAKLLHFISYLLAEIMNHDVVLKMYSERRYGCRAMMLETVAAVPGMVGGMLLHLRSLRKFQQSGGWIKALLEEAENERMHLMTMVELVQPKWYERLLVLTVQGVFFNAFFVLYLMSPKLAHRIVGYLEEEAIHSYTEYLKDIDSGAIENVPAPAIAIDYWRLPKDATLKDVIVVIRADEAHHRDVNHFASVSFFSPS